MTDMSGGGFFGGFGGPGFGGPGFGGFGGPGGGGFGGPGFGGGWGGKGWGPGGVDGARPRARFRTGRSAFPQACRVRDRGDAARRAGRCRAGRATGFRRNRGRIYPAAGPGGARHWAACRARLGVGRQRRGDPDRVGPEPAFLA